MYYSKESVTRPLQVLRMHALKYYVARYMVKFSFLDDKS